MAYKKKSTTENEVFVLTLPLEPTVFQHNLLDRIFRAGLMVEHHLMAEELKKLKQLERTKAWKSVNQELADIYSRLKVAKKQKFSWQVQRNPFHSLVRISKPQLQNK